MKINIFLFVFLTCLFSCSQKKTVRDAEKIYSEISTAYEEGRDSDCLVAINELRTKYPDAVEERRKALGIYQKASLRLAQHDLERTMRSLDAVNVSYNAHKSAIETRHQAGVASESELSSLTLERIRRDSLQVRYDVLCAQIRYIHKRQKQIVK